MSGFTVLNETNQELSPSELAAIDVFLSQDLSQVHEGDVVTSGIDTSADLEDLKPDTAARVPSNPYLLSRNDI